MQNERYIVFFGITVCYICYGSIPHRNALEIMTNAGFQRKSNDSALSEKVAMLL